MDDDEDVALLHLIFGTDTNLGDGARDGRLHRDLHLHRLEDHERVAARHLLAGLGGNLTIIDIRRNKVERTISLGGRPWGAMAARK